MLVHNALLDEHEVKEKKNCSVLNNAKMVHVMNRYRAYYATVESCVFVPTLRWQGRRGGGEVS